MSQIARAYGGWPSLYTRRRAWRVLPIEGVLVFTFNVNSTLCTAVCSIPMTRLIYQSIFLWWITGDYIYILYIIYAFMVHLTTECLPQNYRFYRFSRAPSFNVLYLRLAARFSIVAPSLRCIAYGLAERFILHYYFFFPQSPYFVSCRR